jgi:hypothetical protein
MTDPLTAPERDLIQWLADEVGLSKEREAELARRLAGMRAAPSDVLLIGAMSEAVREIDDIVYHSEAEQIRGRVAAVGDRLSIALAKAREAALRTPQAVAPSEGEIEAWADKWAACWNSVSLRLPRDVLKAHQELGSEAVALMRRYSGG